MAEKSGVVLTKLLTTLKSALGSVARDAYTGYELVDMIGNVVVGKVAANEVDWYNTTSGSKLALKSVTVNKTCSGATTTASNLIPAASLLIGVTCKVTTLITGATSFDVGNGSTANLWGNDIAVAAGTVSTLADYAGSSTMILYTSAGNVVLTANGTAFTGGVVAVTAWYLSITG